MIISYFVQINLGVIYNLIIQLMSTKTEQRNLKFKNYEEVKGYSQQTQKTLLVLEDYVLDVTSFQCHHPGGGVFLKNKHLKSIDEEMKFHHPLSLIMANTMVIGSFKKDISRVIQPDLPLMPQIWNIDHQSYMKIVESPHWLFAPSPRMFESDFFESLSHNKWYTITILPTLLSLFLLYSVPTWSTFNPVTALLSAVCGFLLMTLVEYCLHRFIFHSQKWLPDSKVVRYVHYVMHGIHHMLPNDPDRLVYPPALAIVTFLIGRTFMTKLIPIQDPICFAIFWTFFFIGYVCYDVTHYSLHHIDTTNNRNSWLHRLQQYHNQHHFGGQEKGFGVSSPLWDIIFRTGFTKNKKH